MTDNKMTFYHSRWKLVPAIIIALLLVTFGILLVSLAYIGKSFLLLTFSLFFSVLFGFFAVGNILKLFRRYPYITITEEYIQLDTFTKSEVTIYFSDISYTHVSEVSFQKIIEIVLHDEDHYFSQLSLHNKARLFMNRITGFTLFTISVKAIKKPERFKLLKVLDQIIQQKVNGSTSRSIVPTQQHNIEKKFMEKYDATPPVNRSIDRSYFKNSYGYSLFIFAFTFVFIYLLLVKDNSYLFYSIISFILYPFAKVLIDWLFGFKVRHFLDKQKVVSFYFAQFQFLFNLFLFHVSLFVAPVGIVFLLIRYIVIRVKR